MSDTPRTGEEWFACATGQPSEFVVSVDFARQLERELTEAKAQIADLKAGQMTEAKAREVLGSEINADGELDGWTVGISGGEAFLSETVGFTALQLRAIAWWMENMGGKL